MRLFTLLASDLALWKKGWVAGKKNLVKEPLYWTYLGAKLMTLEKGLARKSLLAMVVGNHGVAFGIELSISFQRSKCCLILGEFVSAN